MAAAQRCNREQAASLQCQHGGAAAAAAGLCKPALQLQAGKHQGFLELRFHLAGVCEG